MKLRSSSMTHRLSLHSNHRILMLSPFPRIELSQDKDSPSRYAGVQASCPLPIRWMMVRLKRSRYTWISTATLNSMSVRIHEKDCIDSSDSVSRAAMNGSALMRPLQWSDNDIADYARFN